MDEPKKPRRKKAAPKILHCSFCEKSQHEVRKLIAKGGDFTNPSVLICDECIDLCNEIISEEEFERAKAEPAKLTAYILKQQEAMRDHQERIIDAARILGATLAPGSDTRH
ncbi:ATP-dependent Clp protease ATP-binding subunit ClpX [Achromobacter sp. 2789STDY5608628]|nr:hypothetical protein EC609_19005 [Achromobacter denitrificans]CUJ67968.1 ATP-dependent Clp protease ATP-binding subunit ClpX [Achromobacter sp. 2789STDY5608628]